MCSLGAHSMAEDYNQLTASTPCHSALGRSLRSISRHHSQPWAIRPGPQRQLIKAGWARQAESL